MNFPRRAKWAATKKDHSLNKLEQSYQDQLQAEKLSGNVADFRWEAFKLRLADNTTYSPDFVVLMPDGHIELHEVKGGFCPEKNRIKVKVAAEMFPWFKFVIVRRLPKKSGGGWDYEVF